MIDAPQLRSALALIVAGYPFEVRVLGGREREGARELTWSGYFDDIDAVSGALRRLRGGWTGVYVTPNPVDSALLHRCHNRLEAAQRGATTTDANVTRRRWMLADFDPITYGDNGPIKGIAATDAEKACAYGAALQVRNDLVDAGWALPILADSGNGYHLMWHVDLPADSVLPKRWIDALARAYRFDGVIVDTSIANAARIWKLYGTLACKGANVGDRPWRMAALIDAPDVPETVGEDVIEAFISNAPPVPPVSPVPDKRGDASVRVGASGGEFSASRIVALAGLTLGEPKTRPGGDVVQELTESCLCGRADAHGDRTSYLVTAASGAVGVGCRHGSCEYSDQTRKPGDSWRAFRAKHDPDYSPDGTGESIVAAATARAETIADRLSRDDTGLDLGGFVGAGAAAQSAGALQVMPKRSPRNVKRDLIDVKADSDVVRSMVLDVLSRDKTLYVSNRTFSRVDDGYRMAELTGGALDSLCAKRCEFVQFKLDKETETFVPKPEALPARILTQLGNLLVEDMPMFRQVDQVTRAPFFTRLGVMVATPGHNPDANVLLVDCPPVSASSMPSGEFAIDAIRDLVRDFPFEGGTNGPEFANWLGALIAPMVRPMIHGPMPLLLIEANRPGTGKTLLAQLIQTIYGLPAEVGPMQRDEAAFSKQMLSILREFKPVHVFDNVKHAVISQSLDMVLTSETYTDRVLGESKSLHLRVLTLWIMTSNNARLSADMTRRFIRCRLVSEVETPEERTDIERPNLLRWAAENRGEILSWLMQIVQEWVAAGMPIAGSLPRLGSFESFGEVIGSILAFHGERQWLGNLRAAKLATTVDDEWEPFLATWWSQLGIHGNPVKSKALHALCVEHGLMGSLLSYGNELSQVQALGRALSQRRDVRMYGYLITCHKDRNSQSTYHVKRYLAAVEPIAG